MIFRWRTQIIVIWNLSHFIRMSGVTSLIVDDIVCNSIQFKLNSKKLLRSPSNTAFVVGESKGGGRWFSQNSFYDFLGKNLLNNSFSHPFLELARPPQEKPGSATVYGLQCDPPPTGRHVAELFTGQARLIRSHLLERFCLELSGNSN